MVMEKEWREERIVRNVQVCMRIEGFELSERTKADCAAVISGRRTAKALVEERLRKYSVK